MFFLLEIPTVQQFLLLFLFSKFYKNYQYKIDPDDKKYEICRKINIFSLSSFTYSLIGIYFLYKPLKEPYFQEFYPYFLILQGILSFLSDSVYDNKEHISHKLDVIFASYNTILAFIIAIFIYKVSPIYLFLLFFAVFFLKIGGICRKKSAINLYMICHILWHCLIPFTGFYVIHHDISNRRNSL